MKYSKNMKDNKTGSQLLHSMWISSASIFLPVLSLSFFSGCKKCSCSNTFFASTFELVGCLPRSDAPLPDRGVSSEGLLPPSRRPSGGDAERQSTEWLCFQNMELFLLRRRTFWLINNIDLSFRSKSERRKNRRKGASIQTDWKGTKCGHSLEFHPFFWIFY